MKILTSILNKYFNNLLGRNALGFWYELVYYSHALGM